LKLQVIVVFLHFLKVQFGIFLYNCKASRQ
jgi:hypothetical protein